MMCRAPFALLALATAGQPNNHRAGLLPRGQGGWRGSTLTDKTSSQYESAYGHELHLFRVFGWASCRNFNADELAFADRGGILWYSIQPTDWAAAASDASTIARCASVIKSLGDKKVMVSIGHEPDIHCESGGSHAYWGSPKDYRAMWSSFRSGFQAAGVKNAIFVMDFSRNIGYPESAKTCSWKNVQELWPGDDAVDWLFFNVFSDQPKSSGSYDTQGDFQKQAKSIYNRLESNAAPGHNYTAATWGIGAFGAMEHEWSGTTISDADRSAFIDAAADALNTRMFPRLRALNWFDSNADNDCTITAGMMGSYKQYLSSAFFTVNDGFSTESNATSVVV